MEVMRNMTIDTELFELGDIISFTLTTGEKVKAKAIRETPNGMLFITVDCLKDEPVSVRRFYGMKNRRERIAFQGSETGTWEWYWLQNKVEDSASNFANVSGNGLAGYSYASYSNGVRPVFLLS